METSKRSAGESYYIKTFDSIQPSQCQKTTPQSIKFFFLDDIRALENLMIHGEMEKPEHDGEESPSVGKARSRFQVSARHLALSRGSSPHYGPCPKLRCSSRPHATTCNCGTRPIQPYSYIVTLAASQRHSIPHIAS